MDTCSATSVNQLNENYSHNDDRLEAGSWELNDKLNHSVD